VLTKVYWSCGIILLLSFGCLSCKFGPKITPETAAIVNKKEIKMADIEKVYQNRIKQSKPPGSPEESQTLRLAILQQLISDEILMQRAAKDNLEATEAEVSTKFTDFKKNFTEERFQQWLKEQSITADDIRTELKKNSTIEKLYNKEITSKITVSDAEISDYYTKNIQTYNLPDTWHVLHILVTPVPDPQVTNAKGDDAKTVPEAQEKVVRLLKRVLSGEDFSILARDYSEDANSAPTGGDLQFLSVKEMDQLAGPAFRQAVQSLKPGETYPKPVVTQFGYHIVKVLEKVPAGQRDLSDPRVQTDIRQTVFGRRETLLKNAYLDAVRNEATVTNLLAQKILDDMGKTTQPVAKK
jgi:peptidyl-prolyl cis-trans isomerase SurA